MSRFATVLSTLLFIGGTASASTLLINFETVPPEPTGPSTFAAAGPMQTITVPGVATITGGVILGDATNLPAAGFATPPNVYGTAGFGDVSLSSTLTIMFDPAFGTVSEVSFPLFNGATQTESYVVNAFNGATVVGTQTLSDLPSNTSSGFAIADLIAPSITQITIAPSTLNATCCSGWDYFIDSVAVNQSVSAAFSAPEPATFGVLGSALLGFWMFRRAAARRSRTQQ